MSQDRIRLAQTNEVVLLQELERAAGKRFADLGMVEMSEVPALASELLLSRIEAERVWVFILERELAGFVMVDLIEDCVHIKEISVLPKHGRQGLATQLLEKIAAWSEKQNARAITLTTFRDIPWNMPFYKKLGYVEAKPGSLPIEIQEMYKKETSLQPNRGVRVCMEKVLRSRHRTTDELRAGLASVQRSPQNHGRLRFLFRRPERDQREELHEACLDLVEGLVGDNWKARGSSRTEDGAAHPETQLTIINTRSASLFCPDPERWKLTGDQLFLDMDLSHDNLPPRTRLSLGDAVLEITAMPHNGCKKFAQRFGKDAVRFVNSDEGSRLRLRGVNARIVKPGIIRVGDIAIKEPGSGH